VDASASAPPSDPGAPTSGPVSAPSQPAYSPTTSGEASAAAATGGLLHNPVALIGMVAVVVAVLALGWWMMAGGSGSTPDGVSVSADTGAAAAGITPVADDRPSVAILYFDNLTGDESLDWLRSGITELLVTDLSQSPELRVLTTDALYEILDETGNLESKTTSAALVREVAERGNVDNVVVGSFIRAGDTFRLSARLQRPATGETLAAETVEGVGEDSVFDSVDDLTRRIKDRLQVPISSSPVVDRDLSDVTTASMDAYRNYTDGVNLISQNRSEEAIPVFERALEIDPEFAMAFAKLSVVYGNLRDFEQERFWAEKAIEHADRLTQRERYYIEGRYYSTRAETIPQAIEAYESALALYPDDSASGNNVANAYMVMEQYDKAVAAYEETLRRGTPFLPAYLNTALSYANAGDCDRAMELMRDFARGRPEYHFAYYDLAATAVQCSLPDDALTAAETYRESVAAGAPADVFDGYYEAQALILLDEFERAAEAAERIANSPSPRVRLTAYPTMRALIAQYKGDQQEAVDIFTQATESAADSPEEGLQLWMRTALADIGGGAPEAALQALDRASEDAQLLEQDQYVAAVVAIAQARAGRTVAARTAARAHERLSSQLAPPWARRAEMLVAAEVARSQGDLGTARDRLEEAMAMLPPGPSPPVFADEVLYAFPLAEVRLAEGDAAGAAELFERITELGSQRLYYPYEYVRSFYYLGKIAQDDGNTAAARRNYQRFLDYWGDGELDRDRVDEARAFISGN
jgi:tetratricopeptide (TPR) repeat protein/TolB-like protein